LRHRPRKRLVGDRNLLQLWHAADATHSRSLFAMSESTAVAVAEFESAIAVQPQLRHGQSDGKNQTGP
jgi:hypothetical protein